MIYRSFQAFSLCFILLFDIVVIQVIFCLFLKEDVALYRERMPLMFPSQRSEPEGAEEKGDTNTDSKDKAEEEDLAKL